MSFQTVLDENGFATITTAEAADITSNSASSGEEITDEGASSVTERGIVYSTTNDPKIESAIKITRRWNRNRLICFNFIQAYQ